LVKTLKNSQQIASREWRVALRNSASQIAEKAVENNPWKSWDTWRWFSQIVQMLLPAAARKFPGAGNFAGNFSHVRRENLRLCPKCAKSALAAGTGAGNPGNFAPSP
jgi:hypothetical protein